MDTSNALMRAVTSMAPSLGEHPAAVWDAAKAGAQRAADALPEGLDGLRDLIRKHPVLATCAVLAVGGLLSARGSAGRKPA